MVTLPQQHLSVLLVSADPLFRSAVRAKLDSWGRKVFEAETEAEAVRLIGQEALFLAIIDLDLPDDAGARLSKRIRGRENVASTYILAYGSEQGRRGTLTALEAKADSFAAKPMHPGELQARVEQAANLVMRNEELFHGTARDLPAGLVSPQAFERFYGILYAQFQRVGGSGALLFIELVNRADIYGGYGFQAAYDTELEIARRLVTLHRSSDFVARIAEGRFCMLLTNTTSLQAHTVALRVASVLQGLHIQPEGCEQPLVPRLSLSLADFPAKGSHPSELMDNLPLTPVAVFNGAE